MFVRRYSDADAFYERVEPFLIAREAENNLLFGVLSEVRNGTFREHPPYMACVERAGEVVLVGLRTPPFNLIISTTDTPEAIQPLIEDVRAVYDKLTGMIAVTEVSEQAARAWQAVSGQMYQRAVAMATYKLERVKPVIGVPGRLRRANDTDRELATRWMVGFYRDAFGVPDEVRAEETIKRFWSAQPETRGLCFWEIDGQPVSMGGYSGPTPHGMRVGAVYTPPELRGRGYASAFVAAVSQYILDMGRTFCFLFTDLSNPTSNHIYQEIGYVRVCDVDEYAFEG